MADSERAITELTMFDICLLQTRASRNVQNAVNQRLEAFGITMMEWLLLGVVKSGGSGGLSMTAVASGLDVTLPQVTALTAKLLQTRLLRQKTQSHDRRSRHVILTTKGKAVLDEVGPLANSLLDTIRQEIGAERVDAYAEALEELGYYDKPLND